MTRTFVLNPMRLAALLALVSASQLSQAQEPNDVEWGNVSPTGGDWNVGANWPQFGFVPEEGDNFNEQAVIANGGLAFLTASAPSVGGVFLGATGQSTGAVEIRSGGSLTVVDNGVTTGLFNVGVQNGEAGFLTVERGGSLTTKLLRSGAGDSSIVLGSGTGSGVATVNVTSGTVLRTDTRLTPDVSFTTGELVLGGQSNLITEITATSQPSISVGTFANLGGNLELDFDGVTPGLGDSWTVLEAGAIGAGFGSIDRSGLSPGLRYTQSIVPNGLRQQLAVEVEADLTLFVNRGTGEATVISESGEPVAISAYNLRSGAGLLNTGYSTLAGQGLGGFVVSGPDGISATQSGELSPTGGISVDGAGFSFGSVYNSPAAPAFGTPVADDLRLDYVRADGTLFTADIEFDRELVTNNLVLTIDPATGQGRLSNDSNTDLEIDAYSIGSESESLLTSWASLGDSGFTGWQEANPSTGRVSELNPTGSLALGAGVSIDLDGLWDAASTADASDVDLEFRDTTLGEFDGVVVFETLTAGVAGDYNEDGRVDAADYTVWRDASPTDVLPNDATPGVVDESDYTVWRGNFGKSFLAGAPATAVPEPSSVVATLLGLLACLIPRRRVVAAAATRAVISPRSPSMSRVSMALAGIAALATTATAQPVTIVASDVLGLPGAFSDGSITITPFDNSGLPSTFGPAPATGTPRFFGPSTGTNVNAINDVDGDPATTIDRDTLTIELASGVALADFGFAFSRANPILLSGFGSDPQAFFSIDSSNNGTVAYDATTGTLAVYYNAFNANQAVVSFNNAAASDGQTLLLEVSDLHFAGPQLALDQITYDPNLVGLLEGDVDGLNGVTIDDFNIIQANFWTEGARADGDLTGDGFVSLVDFTQWEANFAGNSTGLQALLPIPEPSAAVLAVLMGLGGITRRNRR